MSPSGGGFVVVLFLVVRRQEGDGRQVFVLRSDASDDAEPVDLAVDTGAAALLDGDLDVSVILQEERRRCCDRVGVITLLQQEWMLSTNLGAVVQEKDCGVRGIDVNRLQLD